MGDARRDPEPVGELPAPVALEKAEALISSRTGVLTRLVRGLKMVDLPAVHQYFATYSRTEWISDASDLPQPGAGTALDPERARLKAIGEALERYAGGIYRATSMPTATRDELPSTLNSVDPRSWSGRVESEEAVARGRYRWTRGIDLNSGAPTLLPSQLVYVPYWRAPGEPVLRGPTSNGLASGTSWWGAVTRALLEIIEREAFLLTYLHQHAPQQHDLAALEDRSTRRLLDELPYSGLELSVLDISTDIPVHVALAVGVDRSGRYPALTLGAKASFARETAVVGAIEEVFHSLAWGRRLVAAQRRSPGVARPPDAPIRSLEDRLRSWSGVDRLADVEFLLRPSGVARAAKTPELGSGERVADGPGLVAALKPMGVDTFAVDLTTADVRAYGFRVARVLSPQIHPLYLEETLRSTAGSRLLGVPTRLGWPEAKTNPGDLNRLPHPFL